MKYIMCTSPLNRPSRVFNPVSINAFEFAKQLLEIRGRIRASHFSGVRDALFLGKDGLGKDDTGEIEYALQGEKGRSRKYGLQLTIDGQLHLICQRCLGEMEYTLHHITHFDLVANEADLPEDDDDDIDYLVADTDLNVEQLIGQELLLGLPLAPKHENTLCSNSTTTESGQKPNPFSVLQGLKSGS